MDSTNRRWLNAALVHSQQECNQASAVFQPADPYAFLGVAFGAMAKDKTVFDTRCSFTSELREGIAMCRG